MGTGASKISMDTEMQEMMKVSHTAHYQVGVYQNRLLARKVYDAAILGTVLGQEGGLVPSEGFPKPSFS